MKLSKYHGLGNDFIITTYQDGIDYKNLAIKLCNRHLGIGADGFIVCKKEPLEMIFYNQDGTLAPMCGNGIRAFAMYVYEQGYAKNNVFDVLTGAGKLEVNIINNSSENFEVKIMMGRPIFDNKLLHANTTNDLFGFNANILGKDYKLFSFFMGTIHTVILTDDLNILEEVGNAICNYHLFSEKTNVNFVKKIDETNYEVKTYERGVGFTHACGTGACASFVTLNRLNLVGDMVKIHLKYGILTITKENNSIYMQGPACHVFDTEIEDKNEF